MQFNQQTGEVTSSGVTRVTHGAPTEALQSPLTEAYDSTRVGNVKHSLDFGGESAGQARSSGVTKYTVGQDAPVSLMGTLQRDHNGTSVEVRPGMRMHLQTALRLGYVNDLGGGRYEDAKHPDINGAQRNPTEAPSAETATGEQGGADEGGANPDAQFFDPAEMEAFAADIEPLSQVGFDAATALAAVATLEGTDLSAAARRLVQEEGMEPAEAAEMVDNVYSVYEGAVSRALTPEGITDENRQEFYEFCRGKRHELQNAIQTLVHGKSMQGWRHLAIQFRGYQGRHGQ
jgi:hypothetical protein